MPRQKSRLPIFVDAGYRPVSGPRQYPAQATLYWRSRSSSLVERVELHRQKIAVDVPYRAEETSCLEILEQELKKKKKWLAETWLSSLPACSHDRPCAVHCRQQFSVAQFVALFVLVGSNKNHFGSDLRKLAVSGLTPEASVVFVTNLMGSKAMWLPRYMERSVHFAKQGRSNLSIETTVLNSGFVASRIKVSPLWVLVTG